MFTITQSATNTIVVTLTEKLTYVASPMYYLFAFTSDESNVVYSCNATQVTNNQRYNEFTIVEQASPNRTLGQIQLKTPGFYHYEIYAQGSSTNLIPASANQLLEIGKAFVITPITLPSSYDSQAETIQLYNDGKPTTP